MLDKLKRDYARSSKNKKTLIVMAIYRAGNELFYSNLNGVLKRPLMLLLKIAKFLFVEIPYGTELPFETKIGGGLQLDHAKGLIIHPSVVIGENCTIFHQVTIGENHHRLNHSVAPKIGDNVFIGAGAKVFGAIEIGSGTKIGANAVVTKSVPENSVVVGFNKLVTSTKTELRRND